MDKPTPHEALIYLMVVTSAADRDMTDEELRRIGDVVRNWPVFEGFDEDRIIPAARNCRELIHRDGGLAGVVGIACEVIPERLADTAYSLAFEVAAVDLEMRMEERRILQMLRGGLGLSDAVVAAIERAAKARSRMLT